MVPWREIGAGLSSWLSEHVGDSFENFERS
jgi:hypothetical protein